LTPRSRACASMASIEIAIVMCNVLRSERRARRRTCGGKGGTFKENFSQGTCRVLEIFSVAYIHNSCKPYQEL
jgi:hypothetical protein